MATKREIIAKLEKAVAEKTVTQDTINNLVQDIHDSTENIYTRRDKRTALRAAMRKNNLPEEWIESTFNREEYKIATQRSNDARDEKLKNIKTFDYNVFADLIDENIHSKIRARLYLVLQLATGCRFKATLNPDHFAINFDTNNVIVYSSKQDKWIERPIAFISVDELYDLLHRIDKMDNSKSVSNGVNRLLEPLGITSHDLRRIYSEVIIAQCKPKSWDRDLYRQQLFGHTSMNTVKHYAYIRIINIPPRS